VGSNKNLIIEDFLTGLTKQYCEMFISVDNVVLFHTLQDSELFSRIIKA